MAIAVANYARALLVEADADGGVLAARYDGSMDEQAPSLASLLGALPTYPGSAAEIMGQLQQLPGGGRMLVAAPDAEAALHSVRQLADDLEELRYRLTGETLVLDVGRVRPDSPSLMLAEQSEGLIAVVRPDLESLQCLMARLPLLQQQIPRILVAVRGDGPYDLASIRASVAQRAGTPIAVVGVPEDPGGVAGLYRSRIGGWPGLTGRASASLMHSARVLVMLLVGPAPGDEWSTPGAHHY